MQKWGYTVGHTLLILFYASESIYAYDSVNVKFKNIDENYVVSKEFVIFVIINYVCVL